MNNNALYENLPDGYKGYKIDTSYQTAIQVQEILDTSDLADFEAVEIAIDYLFDIIPPVEMWIDALVWWLNGWNHDTYDSDTDKTPIMDFYQDQWRIISAFRMQYGIDLTDRNTDLHFWLFMGLLNNLNECAYTRVCGIRSQKITSDMSVEEKALLYKQKRMFRIMSDEVKAEIEEEKRRISAILD